MKFEPGDVVLVQWNERCSNYPTMKAVTFQIGIIEYAWMGGYYFIVQINNSSWNYSWHFTSLTLSSKGDFK